MPLQTRFSFAEPTVSEARFLAHVEANPQVYELLRRFALEARRSGRRRMGIAALFERVRWFTAIETHGDDFKLNNNWRAFYARLLMQNEPELAGFFETRVQRAA
jgi:hypothetical protein